MSDNKMVVYNANEDLSLARAYQKSGIFAGANAETNLVKMHAGRALGIDPVTSLSNIHLVQGKITLGATVVGALIKRSNKYNYRIVKHDNERCELAFYELFEGKWVEVGTSIFTMEDAKQAGVTGKSVWKQFTRNMLFSRALTNGARWFCPDVFGGPVYTIEELEDNGSVGSEDKSPYSNLSWKKFLALAKSELNLEEEEVKTLLKSKFDGYDKSLSETMFNFLKEESLVEGEYDEVDVASVPQ